MKLTQRDQKNSTTQELFNKFNTGDLFHKKKKTIRFDYPIYYHLLPSTLVEKIKTKTANV